MSLKGLPARLNTDLAAIFAAIEASANGYPSEHDIKGLFADFDTFDASHIDLFGDAYEFLISKLIANVPARPARHHRARSRSNPSTINSSPNAKSCVPSCEPLATSTVSSCMYGYLSAGSIAR